MAQNTQTANQMTAKIVVAGIEVDCHVLTGDYHDRPAAWIPGEAAKVQAEAQRIHAAARGEATRQDAQWAIHQTDQTLGTERLYRCYRAGQAHDITMTEAGNGRNY